MAYQENICLSCPKNGWDLPCVFCCDFSLPDLEQVSVEVLPPSILGLDNLAHNLNLSMNSPASLQDVGWPKQSEGLPLSPGVTVSSSGSPVERSVAGFNLAVGSPLRSSPRPCPSSKIDSDDTWSLRAELSDCTDQSSTHPPRHEAVASSWNQRKTALCKYFLSGNCTRGDECHFAHGQHELRIIRYANEDEDALGDVEQEAKIVLDKRVVSNRKTRLCRNYFETGVCTFSVNCNFAHGLGELKQGAGKTGNSYVQDQGNSGSLFPLWDQSYSSEEAVETTSSSVSASSFSSSNASDRCARALYKTRMCKHFYKYGKCWLQEGCCFAHGSEDIRQKPE